MLRSRAFTLREHDVPDPIIGSSPRRDRVSVDDPTPLARRGCVGYLAVSWLQGCVCRFHRLLLGRINRLGQRTWSRYARAHRRPARGRCARTRHAQRLGRRPTPQRPLVRVQHADGRRPRSVRPYDRLPIPRRYARIELLLGQRAPRLGHARRMGCHDYNQRRGPELAWPPRGHSDPARPIASDSPCHRGLPVATRDPHRPRTRARTARDPPHPRSRVVNDFLGNMQQPTPAPARTRLLPHNQPRLAERRSGVAETRPASARRGGSARGSGMRLALPRSHPPRLGPAAARIR